MKTYVLEAPFWKRPHIKTVNILSPVSNIVGLSGNLHLMVFEVRASTLFSLFSLLTWGKYSHKE